MELILFILFVLIVGAFQYYMGLLKKQFLGLMLPLGVVILWVVLLIKGQISFSVTDIVVPLLFIIGLIGIFAKGEKRAK